MKTRLMQLASLLVGVALGSVAHLAAAPPITIKIDKSSFSDIYPAVWFNPDEGTIHKFVEESERPPADGAILWLEPSDPEFAAGPEIEGVGMCVIGYGPEVFADQAVAKMIAARAEKVDQLDEASLREGRQAVIVIETPTGQSMVMIDKCDPDAELLEFRWQSLGKAKAAPPAAGGAHAAETERRLKATKIASIHFDETEPYEAIEFLRLKFRDANPGYLAGLPKPSEDVPADRVEWRDNDFDSRVENWISIKAEAITVWDALHEVVKQAKLKFEITPKGHVNIQDM